MLKKKFAIITLVCLLCLCVAMLFVACNGTQGEKGDKGENGKDGVSIVSVEKIGSEGLTDTYQITFSDGDTTTFTVTNGKNGTDGENGLTPHIGENGNWWIGETDTKIPARGQDGNDGSDGQDGQDGQDGNDGLTPYIGENGNWWIGETDTKIPARGQDGNDGSDGISISDANIENGELILVLSDGENINVGKIVGDNGKDGQDGISITGTTIDENGNLVLLLSNGTQINAGNVKGKDGADGQDGTNGKDGISITGVEINEGGELIISFSEGEAVNLGKITGADGQDGINGTDGKNGVGISRIELDEYYNLTIYLTEGEPINLGCIRGEKGEAGQDGTDGANGKSAYELYKEKYGYEGTEEEWLIDLVNGNLSLVEMHTVTFDAQGGSPTPQSQQIKNLGKIVKPEIPVKDGFVFDGWYYQGEKWSFVGYVVTEDMTLTAQWSKENGNCSIVSADGFEFSNEIINEQSVDVISRKLANATQSYNLASVIKVSEGATWKLFKDYAQTQEIVSKLITDLNEGDNEAWLAVYSGAEQKLYKVNLYRRCLRTITFNFKGSSTETVKVEEDNPLTEEMIPKVAEAEKAGYHFIEWQFDTQIPFIVSTDKTINATAKFEANTNILHFDGNGATSGVTENMMIATDTTATLVPNGFKKAGYHFIGWATESSGGKVYNDKDSYTMGTNSEYTLYAVWEVNINTFRFEGENGQFFSFTKEGNIEFALPLSYDLPEGEADLQGEALTKRGMTYGGWLYEDEITAVFKIPDYAHGETFTFSATWKYTEYTISYEGIPEGNTIDFNLPETFTLEDLENESIEIPINNILVEGYAFFGWYNENGEFVRKLTEESTLLKDKEMKDIIIRGDFRKGSKCFTYNENVITAYDASLVEEGEILIIPDNIEIINCSNTNIETKKSNSLRIGINSKLISLSESNFQLNSGGHFIIKNIKLYGSCHASETNFVYLLDGVKLEDFKKLNSTVDNNIIYEYSETKPSETGNYWHFVNGEPVIW